MKRVHVYISGRVQGVFFRASTQDTARRLHLTGWVRNRPDGRVEALFEGQETDVHEMLLWCKKGPPGAAVRELETMEEPSTGEFTDFQIRY